MSIRAICSRLNVFLFIFLSLFSFRIPKKSLENLAQIHISWCPSVDWGKPYCRMWRYRMQPGFLPAFYWECSWEKREKDPLGGPGILAGWKLFFPAGGKWSLGKEGGGCACNEVPNQSVPLQQATGVQKGSWGAAVPHGNGGSAKLEGEKSVLRDLWWCCPVGCSAQEVPSSFCWSLYNITALDQPVKIK